MKTSSILGGAMSACTGASDGLRLLADYPEKPVTFIRALPARRS